LGKERREFGLLTPGRTGVITLGFFPLCSHPVCVSSPGGSDRLAARQCFQAELRSEENNSKSTPTSMSTLPPRHTEEPNSNTIRDGLARVEPRAMRTYTPTQAVLARSAGIYHWTPEGRRLYDFTSGVLVTNLGHNPQRWTERFFGDICSALRVRSTVLAQRSTPNVSSRPCP
jgi:hypothetical protein